MRIVGRAANLPSVLALDQNRFQQTLICVVLRMEIIFVQLDFAVRLLGMAFVSSTWFSYSDGSRYCGNTTAYCTSGCQKAFGDCSTSAPDGGDETCGPAFGNVQCPTGKCCSAAGFCGTTEDYCQDPSCQYQYGICDSNTTPTGPTTLDDPRPLLGKVSYDDDVYDCVENNVIALTYDDGPYLYTSQLLDTLKSFGFHATFFITGNNLGKGPIDTTAPYPSIIQRMINEGHQVASHTWSHYSLSNITSDMRKQQMVKNERAFANIIGKYPTYMRPPYSQCDAASGCQADMKALGYHRIYFDLDTQDYLNPLPTQIQAPKNIVKAALGVTGITDYLSIQHDIVQQSVTNLTSYYYDLIKARGWKGVTAGECLQDPQANWYRTPGGTITTTATTPTPISVPPSTAASTKRTIITTIATSSTSTYKSTSKSSSTTTVRSTSESTFSTTTSKPTLGTSSTTRKTSTSIAVPQAELTCTVKAGMFCGTIPAFGDKKGCQKSAASCYQQAADCPSQAGKQYKAACKTYMNDCMKLTAYCFECGFICSSTGFSRGS